MQPDEVRPEAKTSSTSRDPIAIWETLRMGISKRYSVVHRSACLSMDLAHWSLGSAAPNRFMRSFTSFPRWRSPREICKRSSGDWINAGYSEHDINELIELVSRILHEIVGLDAQRRGPAGESDCGRSARRACLLQFPRVMPRPARRSSLCRSSARRSRRPRARRLGPRTPVRRD